MKTIIKFLTKIPADKLLHVIVALLIYAGLHDFCKIYLNELFSTIISFIITVFLCILKEVYDKKDYGLFDKYDLIAGVVGTILGVIIKAI